MKSEQIMKKKHLRQTQSNSIIVAANCSTIALVSQEYIFQWPAMMAQAQNRIFSKKSNNLSKWPLLQPCINFAATLLQTIKFPYYGNINIRYFSCHQWFKFSKQPHLGTTEVVICQKQGVLQICDNLAASFSAANEFLL